MQLDAASSTTDHLLPIPAPAPVASVAAPAGSICTMKRNTHAIIPEQRFRVTQGEGELSCYTFGTQTAKHLFCRTCGVCPFYRPRSNPDGYAGRQWGARQATPLK